MRERAICGVHAARYRPLIGATEYGVIICIRKFRCVIFLDPEIRYLELGTLYCEWTCINAKSQLVGYGDELPGHLLISLS